LITIVEWITLNIISENAIVVIIMIGMEKRILQSIACIAVVLLLIIFSTYALSVLITPTNAETSSDLPGQPISDASKCSVPTKIVLIRHGQTSWNVLGLLQGNADVPLDATGVAQAQMLANSTYNKTVNVVYSSPLSRAYDTAKEIADLHQLPVEVRGNLREIGVGIYTGYQTSQIPSDVRISWSTNPDFAMPSGVPNTTNLLDPPYVENIYFEGESLNMAADRTWHGLTNLAKQHCGENIVSVTHGGIIQIALTKVYDLPVTQYSSFKVPTASQTVLEFEPNSSVFVLPDW
jgi:broad specificity phosphatase PhoE